MTLGMAGIRTTSMYLTAEELGRKKPENVHWILSGCFLYSILISLSVSVILYTIAPVLAEKWIGDMCVVNSLRIFSFFIPVNCLCGVMVGYFTASNKIGTLAAVEIAEQLCSMALTASLLLLWAKHDPARSCEAVILGSGAGGCLTLGTLIYMRLREHSDKYDPIPVRARLMQVAVPLGIADNMKAAINTTENIMVPKRLALHPNSTNPLATFGTVCGMVFPVLMFPAAILFGLAELLIPELAKCAAADNQSRIRYLTRKSLRIALLYGCLFSGMMFIIAQPLCDKLYHSSSAGYWLKRYALLIPMLYCDAITDAITKGLGQQKACVRYNIFTSVMDVVLLYIMLPTYGMSGYYFSFAVTHAINFGLSLNRLFKITHRTPKASTPVRTLLAFAVALCICSAAANSIIGCISYPITLMCLLTLFRVIGKEDILWLKTIIRPA